ncbi:MAG: magnesium transporter [Chloroflexi bacterium]|nr:magnesium transporter [Chloroflexota bacterium]MCY3939320.1 magnesium transporter [Chloroflexota bacterium]
MTPAAPFVPDGSGNLRGEMSQPQAISLDEVAAIADEIQELIDAGEERSAWNLIRKLHPADMGSIIAGLPRTSRDAMIRIMSPETVAWMLRQMNPIQAGRVGRRLGSRLLSSVLSQIQPQQALATLRRLPVRRARRVTELLEQPLATEEILAHAPGTAGALMVSRFPTVMRDGRVEEARDSLKALDRQGPKSTHVLVTDDGGNLVGQISMIELALVEDATPVSAIATPVVATVTKDTPAEECARLERHYNLTQLSVIERGRLIGVILAESLLGATVEHDTRQMQQVANVAGEGVDAPLSSSIRIRLPWLTLNLATTFLAAATVSLFESTLAQVVVLAAFLPVVAGQGGIGGTQTLTLIVRAIALGELVGISARRLLTREAVLGLVHGVWLGVLVAAIAILWKQNVGLGIVLGLAMLGNMLIVGSVGAGVPLFLRRIGLDPAVASAVIVTTVTDVFGFLLFLGIASAAINLIR